MRRLRVVGHLVVLVVICTSVWVSGSAATPKSRGAVAPATAADASNSVPSWLQLPASTALEGSRPRATQGPTQGADQSVAAVVNPGLALPMWVRPVQDSPLWSSADPGATTLGQLAGQTSYLKP